jgi:hypothetical protein
MVFLIVEYCEWHIYDGYGICLFTFQESGEPTETMSSKDAAMFPLIASATLFGLYIFFQVRLLAAVFCKTVFSILGFLPHFI